MSDEFIVETGMRQGIHYSPYISTLILNQYIKEIIKIHHRLINR